MKKLLLTLLLAAGTAHAEIIATMPNKAGGLIYLTDVSSEKCKPWRTVFANNDSGKSIWGCWFLDDVVIHIKWDDSGTSTFHAGSFTLMKKNKGSDL